MSSNEIIQTYYDPETFASIKVSVDYYHWNLTQIVKNRLDLLDSTPTMVNENGNKLTFGVMIPRIPGQKESIKFKVTIEKIKEEV